MSIEKTDNFMASLGIEVYRVGGSVRDELKGLRPKDADYMVRGVTLNQLDQILMDKGGVDTKVTPMRLRQGGQFGWRVFDKAIGFVEISLPRTEVSDGPGRAMRVSVDPNLSLAEDAKRRDFTFNALYKAVPVQHVNGWGDKPYGDLGIVDPTGRGMFDLERGYIATTHEDSFRDDPLRMLRALRFVARGFTLNTETRNQMVAHAHEVDGLTARGHTSGTLLDELVKILMGDHAAEALRVAAGTGVLAVAIPELAPMIGFQQDSRYHDMATDEHTFKAIETAAKANAPLRVRMALLFHDSGKPEAAWRDDEGRLHYYSNGETEDHEVVGVRIWRQFAARVNAGRALREEVATLIQHHMLTAKPKASRVNRMRVKLGDEMLRDLILHRACDISGKNAKVDSQQVKDLAAWEVIRRAADEVGVPASVKDLKISGKDAMNHGLDGAAIGAALRAVLDDVIVQPTADKLEREWQLVRLGHYIA